MLDCIILCIPLLFVGYDFFFNNTSLKHSRPPYFTNARYKRQLLGLVSILMMI